jgi:hypothetical protein
MMPTWAVNGWAAKPGGVPKTKVPFVVAVSLNSEGHPLYTQMIPVPGFTCATL